MASRVTFIRHAQSLQNAGMGNIINSGLSPMGIQQAKAVVASFECVVLSSLRRAVQTYSYSHIDTGKLLISDLFREHRSWGHPSNFLENETVVRETDQELTNRAKKAMRFLHHLPYKNIGVITHHDFTAEFSKLVNNGKPIYLDNCGTFSFGLRISESK